MINDDVRCAAVGALGFKKKKKKSYCKTKLFCSNFCETHDLNCAYVNFDKQNMLNINDITYCKTKLFCNNFCETHDLNCVYVNFDKQNMLNINDITYLKIIAI